MNRSMALLDWAFSQREKGCRVREEARYSFADLGSAVVAAATRRADRVGIGTRVGLFIDSPPNFVLCAYAAFYLGAVVTPINGTMEDREVRSLVERLGITVVVSDTPVDLGAQVSTHVVSGEFDVPRVETRVRPAHIGIDDPALLLQTSGSTLTAKDRP